jgi:serine/threonine protein kinase
VEQEGAMDAPKIGRYEVLSLLGRGGMAEVFKCKLVGLGGFDKNVVVKRILADLMDEEEALNMFLDEARLVAGLSHPNIAQVFEVDQDNGLPFIVMDFVRGPTLKDLHELCGEEKPLPIAPVISILTDICEGLEYTHNFKDEDGDPLNIVHRDVSPPNIVVSLEGKAQLLDFGVAKAEVRLAHTRAGMVKGKLAYLAPEQIKGGQVDHRADVFSTGICLYRATTGQYPFRGRSDIEQMASVLKGEFRPPREVMPDYPEELDRIVCWALAYDVEQRCPSAAALGEALDGYARSAGIETGSSLVEEWLGQLFPDPSIFDGTPIDAARVNTPGSGEFSFSGASGHSPQVQAMIGAGAGAAFEQQMTGGALIGPPPSKLPLILGGAAVAALLAVTGVTLGVLLSRPSAGAEQVAQSDQKADDNLRSYLDEAEQLAAGRQFRLALDVLERAEKVASQNSELNIRLATLSTDVRRGYLLAQAKKSLALGDRAKAIEHAGKVLELDSASAEAEVILQEARSKPRSRR